MKIRNQIKRIETNYDVESIKFEDIQIWLEIRNRFFSKLTSQKESNLELTNTKILSLLFSSLHGFFNWFIKYDYWYISDTENRRIIDGKYFDRLMDYPLKALDKGLIIELPLFKHFRSQKTASKYLVSKALLIILEKFYSLVFLNNYKIENYKLLQLILKEEKITLDVVSISKKMIAQYKVMKMILNFNSPKTVFLNPSYTNYGYIKAFKELNIKVYEMQHGVINKNHYGYNTFAKFDNIYKPDKLLTYGLSEIDTFKDNGNTWIDPENIYPCGNFIIDYMCNNFVEDQICLELIKTYKIVASVSLQEDNTGELLMPLLVEAANSNNEIIYLVKTRQKSPSYYLNKITIPKNIIFAEELDVYETILHSDVHITINSSCALEAPALGVKNILFNINNEAKLYYGSILKEPNTYYVNTSFELVEVLSSFEKVDKSIIKAFHKNVIINNFNQNFDDFIRLNNV